MRMGSRSRPPGVPHCPSKVCDLHSLPPVRHRPGSHLSWSFSRFRVLYETVYRAVWVARSRLDVIVFTNRLRGLRPVSVGRSLTQSTSSSRALVHSCRVSRAKAGPAEAELLPWAFFPHRGVIQQSPLTRASQAHFVPPSTFLTSSTACSSAKLRGFVSPRNHVPGSLFRGFP